MEKTKKIPNKWEKIKRLRGDSFLKDYVPETALCNKRTLFSMLEKYDVVYVKPTRGTGGSGVIRVEKNSLVYSYHYKKKTRSFTTFNGFYKGLKKIAKRSKKNNARFIAQKGIPLLKHEGLIFDLRVMVQHNQENDIEITGVLGRVAQPNSIVTNYHAGGKVFSLEQLLSPYMNEIEIENYKKKLYDIGLKVGALYNEVKAIGVDIGMDEDFHPWIIEINFKPDPYVFNQLENKDMFQKIMAYRKYHRAKKRQ